MRCRDLCVEICLCVGSLRQFFALRGDVSVKLIDDRGVSQSIITRPSIYEKQEEVDGIENGIEEGLIHGRTCLGLCVLSVRRGGDCVPCGRC